MNNDIEIVDEEFMKGLGNKIMFFIVISLVVNVSL